MKQIMYYYSDWCGPCKMLGPRMAKLQSEGKNNMRKLNVDTESESAAKHGVRNIPTLILMENGEAVRRKVGTLSELQILEFYNG